MEETRALRSLTLGQILDKAIAGHPDNEAIVYVDRDLRLTYRQFGDLVDRMARGLMALGVQKGEKVAIWSTNIPFWVALQFATAKIGAVLLTVNINYKRDELAYLLRQSETENMFLINGYQDTDYLQTVYELIPELKTQERGYLTSTEFPDLKRVFFLGPEKHRGLFSIPELLGLSAMITLDAYQSRQALNDPHDVVNMQYTSGTTGFPKGVMLTHYNIGNNGYYIGLNQNFAPKDRVCLPVPLFHCFGCVLGVLAAVNYAATLVILETFDPIQIMASIELQVTTVGRALPEIEVRIMDPETREVLPPGRQGEVCCRGYNVMKGYYNMPEATARAIDPDGWLHSGDLGVMDDNGYVSITGRHKDMIIRGGENIYPREIEEFLYKMEGISDVQVVGVPSRKYGEEVGAFIIQKKGHDLQASDVQDFCKGKISRYKIPKFITFVNDYPMTASGKVQKYILRQKSSGIFPDQSA